MASRKKLDKPKISVLLPVQEEEPFSHEYIKQATISLVQEYLHRRKLSKTLSALHAEAREESCSIPVGISNNRRPLVKALQLETLIRLNKTAINDSAQLPTLLEVVVKGFLNHHHSNKLFNRYKSALDELKKELCPSNNQTRLEKLDVATQVGCSSTEDQETQTTSVELLDQGSLNMEEDNEVKEDRVNGGSDDDEEDGEEKVYSDSTFEEDLEDGESLHELEDEDEENKGNSNKPRPLIRSSSSKFSLLKEEFEKEEREKEEDEKSRPSSASTTASDSSSKLEVQSQSVPHLPPPKSPKSPKSPNASSSGFDNEFKVVVRRPPLSPSVPPKKSPFGRKNSTPNPFTTSHALSIEKDEGDGSGEPPGKTISLAESLLQSKQNILAHGCLSASENYKRDKAKGRKQSLTKSGTIEVKITNHDGEDASEPSSQSHSVKKALSPASTVRTMRNNNRRSSSVISPTPMAKVPEGHPMQLCDIEDEDFDFTPSDKGSGNGNELQKPRGKSPSSSLPLSSKHYTKQKLAFGDWKKLKSIVFGDKGFVQDGWIDQTFTFHSRIPFGLVQTKGGPCGVLAVVQSLLLRNLLFGSRSDLPLLLLQEQQEFLIFGNTEDSSKGLSERERSHLGQDIASLRIDALCNVLVEILWNCHQRNGNRKESISICLPPLSSHRSLSDVDVIQLSTEKELKAFVQNNQDKIDCLGLVYSAVMTRGLDEVLSDMDFPECPGPLIGQHGYCSQELIGLLLFGKCVSNVFDNEVELDGKVLKGITCRSDIGLLSLFEHYRQCEIGSYLKSPQYPIWLICSESHFTVLFSRTDEKFKEITENYEFELFYYDGLAKQENIIKLTIKSDSVRKYTSGKSPNDDTADDLLVPPLEKCIRTKWENALVDWNGSEPLL